MADEAPDLEQTHHNLVNEVTGDEALNNSPYLPQGLPQGQSPEWHVNNPKESPLRHFRGDSSIKEYATSAGDYYEQQMRAAGAGDDIIGAARPQVEAAAAGKARQHALSQLENLGRQKEGAHWVEEALPFASGIRQANREKEYQYAEDAFGKGQAGIGDYLTMGEKIGRMKQANDASWYEKMGHIATGGLAFAGEIGMTGGLGASAGAAGAAKLGGGKIAQLAGAGLATTALRPTAAVEEYVRRGDKAPVMGQDGQPLVDAKGNFQFAEPDSEGARVYKTALSQYIDNTIMPNLAGAFTKGTGSYAARVAKKTMAALAAGEASEELKYQASLAPESSDVHQLVFGGAKGRMEALKNLAIKTGGFGIMEAGTQGFHSMDEAIVKKQFEGRIADLAKKEAGPGVDRSIAPTNEPVSPAEQLRQSAQEIAEAPPRPPEIPPEEGGPPTWQEEQARRRGLPAEPSEETSARLLDQILGGEKEATLPPSGNESSERTVEGERIPERPAGVEPAGDRGGVRGGDEGAPPVGPPAVGQGGGAPPEVAPSEPPKLGLKPPQAPSAPRAEEIAPARIQSIVDRNAKQIAKEGVPPEKVSEWLQRRGVRKDLADAAAANWKPSRTYKTPSPTVAKEISKGQAKVDADVLNAAKGSEAGTLADIRDKINSKRQKSGLKPLTDEQVDDSLMRHMDAGSITRHRLSDGSIVYAHNESFAPLKAEAKAEADRPGRRAAVDATEETPEDLKNDIEQLAASGRGTGSEASLRRDAEVNLQKGIQDGVAHANERAGAPASEDAGGTSSSAVQQAPGNKLTANDVLNKIKEMEGPHRKPVHIADLRDALPGASREEMDAAINDLRRSGQVNPSRMEGGVGSREENARNNRAALVDPDGERLAIFNTRPSDDEAAGGRVRRATLGLKPGMEEKDGRIEKEVASDAKLGKAAKDLEGLVVPYEVKDIDPETGKYSVSQEKAQPLDDGSKPRDLNDQQYKDLQKLVRDMWDKGYALEDFAPENLAYHDGKLKVLDLDSFTPLDKSDFSSPEDLLHTMDRYFKRGDEVRKPSAAAIHSLDETPTHEAFGDRNEDVMGRRNDQGLGILADRLQSINVHGSQDELGLKFHYGDAAKQKAAKERGEVASAFADIWPNGKADLNYHTGNHIWDIAHEQGHVISDAMGVERDPEFAAAYDKDMADGQITHYSSMDYHRAAEPDPAKARAKALSEAAAEVDALLHDGGYTDDIEREIPNVAAYFKKKGMWPDEHVQRLPGTVKETREAINALRGHAERAARAAEARGDLAGAVGRDQEVPGGATRTASTAAPGPEGGAAAAGPAAGAEAGPEGGTTAPRDADGTRPAGDKLTDDQAQGVAGALRGAMEKANGGDPADMCLGCALALRRLFPEAKIFEGRFGGSKDPHYIAKVGDHYMDVTADQFEGGAKINVFKDFPGEYRKFKPANEEDMNLGGDPWSKGIARDTAAAIGGPDVKDAVNKHNQILDERDPTDEESASLDKTIKRGISSYMAGDQAIRRASMSKATQSAVDDLVANEPPNKPLDEIKQWAGGAINKIRNALTRPVGASFPATHAADRESGEAMTQYSVSRSHGFNLGEYHADHVLGKNSTEEQEKLIASVGAEMRLRHARQNIGNKIEEAAQAGDEGRVEKLRKKLDEMRETTLGDKASTLKDEQAYQNALNDPYVKGAFDKFKKDTATELDKNYAKYLDIDEKDIDTLTQIPGMPMNFLRATDKGAPKGDFANLNNLRQKGSPFAKAASLDGDYNFNFRDMLMNSFQRGEVAAKGAVMNRTLADKGLLIPANPGETKEGFTNVENVRYRQPGDQVGKTAALISNDVYPEYLRAKDVETPAGWKKISKTINQIPLLGALSTSVEGLSHVKNQLIANFAPGMSIVGTWKNAVEKFNGSDQFKQEMLRLSNGGSAKPPGEHKGVLEQLPLVGQALEKAKQVTGYSLDPTYYMGQFIKGTDEIIRVSLGQAYDAAMPKDRQTEQGRNDMINHWAFNYNKKAMPQILALAKESGIGPFAVASWYGKLRNVSMLFGGHGMQGLSASEDAMMRAQVFRNILTPVLAAAAVNYFTTGRMDGGEDAPPLSIYAGTDEQGKKKYLDIGTLTGISPALRSLGLMAQIEGARKGEAAGDRIDKSTMDIVHALSDPIMGPGPRFAWTAVTGRDTYGKQVAGIAGYGESQARKNLGAAIVHTNPTAASLAEGGKSAGEQVAGALGPLGFKYNEGKAPAVGQFREALKKTTDVFNEARLKARDQGLKIKEPPELKALNKFSETVNKYEVAYHQKGLTDEARQKLRAAQAKVAQTALAYFEKVRSR